MINCLRKEEQDILENEFLFISQTDNKDILREFSKLYLE